MYFAYRARLLTTALMVVIGLSPVVAFSHGGGGGGGGSGGGFHGGGSAGSGGSHPSSGGGTVHASTSAGSTGTRAVSGAAGSTARVGSSTSSTTGGSTAHFRSGSAVTGSTAATHVGGSTAASVHTGAGSHTPTFTSGGTSTFHSGATTLHTGSTGVHTGATGVHTGTTFAHTGATGTTFAHTGATGMHTGATFHSGFSPGVHANPGFHNAGFAHNPGMHVGNLGVAHFGNQNLHLAGAGYHPAYFQHSFYHGPWSGHGWGWGWGLGAGLGFGYGWGGGGFGMGWGYGGMGYGGMGYGGGWGPYGYWGRPLGWGFGAWGLGALAYNSGYSPYYNPYYSQAGANVGYNYANPIPVDTGMAVAAVDTPLNPDQPVDPNQPDPTPVADNPDFDAARTAFSQGDFNAALTNVDAAIAKVPTDAVLHEFRALVLFALQDFRQAAGVIHSVLAVGPGWDWTTMSGLYSDPGLYSQQLRTLEDFTQANPKAADAHFLLAYHYMVCNHKDATANQLQQVVQLQPNDKLAGELLKMVQGPPQQPATPTQPTQVADTNVVPQPPVIPADNQPDLPAIDKDLLPGSWSASRPDGSKFALSLTDDGKFTWQFSGPKQKGDEFSGTYTIDGPVLMLQRAGGGALAGVATFSGNNGFNFKMVGGPPEDKGLDFGK